MYIIVERVVSTCALFKAPTLGGYGDGRPYYCLRPLDVVADDQVGFRATGRLLSQHHYAQVLGSVWAVGYSEEAVPDEDLAVLGGQGRVEVVLNPKLSFLPNKRCGLPIATLTVNSG